MDEATIILLVLLIVFVLLSVILAGVLACKKCNAPKTGQGEESYYETYPGGNEYDDGETVVTKEGDEVKIVRRRVAFGTNAVSYTDTNGTVHKEEDLYKSESPMPVAAKLDQKKFFYFF